jgi:hypothetical protein
MGSDTNSLRTPDQTELALFWMAHTPTHWNRIALTVLNNHARMSLIRKARLFALLNSLMRARAAKVDAREDAGIIDFRNRLREGRESVPYSGEYFRVDYEGSVVAEEMGEHRSSCRTDGRVS